MVDLKQSGREAMQYLKHLNITANSEASCLLHWHESQSGEAGRDGFVYSVNLPQ